jgi:hypothetical protein
MTEFQYLRACALIVDDGRDGALDLSAFRVVFHITAADVQTPNTAIIRVYNLAPATAIKVRSEFKRVTLSAGYGNTPGLIFAGQIRQVIIGNDNATDSFIEIIAADGDGAYLKAFISQTLAAGWTPADLRKTCLDAMAPYGIVAGPMAELPDVKGIRVLPLHGYARDYLARLCDTYAMTWSIALNLLHMQPVAGATSSERIPLNAQTGLIGWPRQTIDGIMIRSLINSKITAGKTVQINSRSVQEARISTTTDYVDMRPGLSSDGDYRVWAASYVGDTRGQDWYMDLVCTGVGQAEPSSQAFIQLKGIYGS